jgi:hypothetical protein
LFGGDPADFPNGGRLFDDVTDIFLRVVAGGILNPSFNVVPNNRLGDGVNTYLTDCPSGRDRRHIDPGEAAGQQTQAPPVRCSTVTCSTVTSHDSAGSQFAITRLRLT